MPAIADYPRTAEFADFSQGGIGIDLSVRDQGPQTVEAGSNEDSSLFSSEDRPLPTPPVPARSRLRLI